MISSLGSSIPWLALYTAARESVYLQGHLSSAKLPSLRDSIWHVAGGRSWSESYLVHMNGGTVKKPIKIDKTLNTAWNFQNLRLTICTASLTFNNSTFCPHSGFMCFVWISEQTAIISLYSINWLVCIIETECVYCAVRTGSLYVILRSAHTVYLCVLCGSENKQRLFPYTALTDCFV